MDSDTAASFNEARITLKLLTPNYKEINKIQKLIDV